MKKLILSAICVIAIASSCKKETGPEGPAGTNGTNGTNGAAAGTITGKIKQNDQFGVEYTTGLNTVTVNIEGTSNSSVTDATGNYTLANVQAGIYNIVFNKPGCGIIKQEQVTFPGNGTLYSNGQVADKPTFAFTTGYVKDTVQFSTHQIRININVAPVTKTRSGIVIFGKTSNVDLSDPTSYDYSYSFNIPNNSAFYTGTSTYNISAFNSYASGATIYTKVYPMSSSASGYYDYAVGTSIYTGFGTPLPTTFTLTMP